MENNTEQLLLRISELEKEISRLHTQIKKERYGLVWLDVPEGFEKETEDKIPMLEEVTGNAITNADGKPTHIIIEGDNYHALTCLNYTHQGKIDVIYIDPPYNTGNDGFTYKDKRVLKEFPDGSPVPREHPLRHSYWLSFMSKRLLLAKNLLSEKGVIFISIDDNEQANCKLLCDMIFGESNFVANIVRRNKAGAGHDSKDISIEYDYMLLYAKSKNKIKLNKAPVDVEKDAKYRYADDFVSYRGKYYLRDLDYKGSYSPSLDYPITLPNGKTIYAGGKLGKPNTWRWSREKYEWGIQNGFIVIDEQKEKIFIKQYQFVDNKDKIRTRYIPYRAEVSFLNSEGSQELNNIIRQTIFSYPKPTSLIEYAEKLASSKDSIILDFFAGSGTTLHATMKLNAEDGGRRQCILVQRKEGDKNICESVTYERNKRVILGYENQKGRHVEGLGNSLKYYRTAFVGKKNSRAKSDRAKIQLSQKAGCLLAIAANTLYEIVTTKHYQVFSDGKGNYTGVYFSCKDDGVEAFAHELESLSDSGAGGNVAAYFLCDDLKAKIADLQGVALKQIPEQILAVYRNINGL